MRTLKSLPVRATIFVGASFESKQSNWNSTLVQTCTENPLPVDPIRRGLCDSGCWFMKGICNSKETSWEQKRTEQRWVGPQLTTKEIKIAGITGTALLTYTGFYAFFNLISMSCLNVSEISRWTRFSLKIDTTAQQLPASISIALAMRYLVSVEVEVVEVLGNSLIEKVIKGQG